MKTLKKIGIGVAFAASTLAVSTVGMSSAQAALTGAITITGASSFLTTADNPVFDSITFNTGSVVNASVDFLSYLNASATVSTLDLTQLAGTMYTASAVGTPWITVTPDLNFMLDGDFTVERIAADGDVTVFNTPLSRFTGTFTNSGGSVLGRGLISANNVGVSGYSLSISALPTSVPEPTTTLGLAALGLGAFFTKSLAKKKKAQVNS
ncbi:PEP-CTERM sorting domain-containing protein [Nodularia chucula]|uniref:PEP-CTERM sorting domain-containing protein n=1 Tax=Nodularia chucula TaxID=3093667 RepID=UPI0039C6FC38